MLYFYFVSSFCLRMHPCGIHCYFKFYLCQNHPHSRALFWISFYSSPLYFISHFCPGRLPCVIPGIFPQCVLYEKLFSTGSCKKKKKKCKPVSLKPSVVHLDLYTVGGTWGLVCCCLKKDVPFTNENTAT